MPWALAPIEASAVDGAAGARDAVDRRGGRRHRVPLGEQARSREQRRGQRRLPAGHARLRRDERLDAPDEAAAAGRDGPCGGRRRGRRRGQHLQCGGELPAIADRATGELVGHELALRAQPCRQPPHHRMEEQQRLDPRLQQVDEIVAARDVRELVRQQGFQQRDRHLRQQRRRHEHRRAPPADRDRRRQPLDALQQDAQRRADAGGERVQRGLPVRGDGVRAGAQPMHPQHARDPQARRPSAPRRGSRPSRSAAAAARARTARTAPPAATASSDASGRHSAAATCQAGTALAHKPNARAADRVALPRGLAQQRAQQQRGDRADRDALPHEAQQRSSRWRPPARAGMKAGVIASVAVVAVALRRAAAGRSPRARPRSHATSAPPGRGPCPNPRTSWR